jgi:hypothetical protein
MGRAVPANDEAVLRFEKIGSLIEKDQVVRIALESLLVRFLFTARYVDLERGNVPTPSTCKPSKGGTDSASLRFLK